MGSPRDGNRGGVGAGGNKSGRGRGSSARSTGTASPHPSEPESGQTKSKMIIQSITQAFIYIDLGPFFLVFYFW